MFEGSLSCASALASGHNSIPWPGNFRGFELREAEIGLSCLRKVLVDDDS